VKEMNLININNKTLWIGADSHPFFWIDLNEFFSIDVGKYFLRIFIKVKQKWNFCRYLGIIRC